MLDSSFSFKLFFSFHHFLCEQPSSTPLIPEDTLLDSVPISFDTVWQRVSCPTFVWPLLDAVRRHVARTDLFSAHPCLYCVVVLEGHHFTASWGSKSDHSNQLELK